MLGGLTMGTPLRPATRPMMTFVEAVKQCLRKYGDFSGRATRAEFWWWTLAVFIGSVIFSVVDSSITSFVSGDGYAFSPLSSIFSLATLLPGLAVTARRMHDICKTGWWQLAWYAIPIMVWMITAVLFFIAIAIAFSTSGDIRAWEFETADFNVMAVAFVPALIALAVALAVTLAVVVWAVVWMVRPSQDGSNQYGPDPRAWDDEEAGAATSF